MDNFVKELIKPILENNPKIKKVIGVYGGRFQPFGPHHLKTYKWLQKQVDEAYITTSNIKKPPRHPMNFREKVRHMTKMGVKANRIIEEKSPLAAINLLKKFDNETTAVVYIFGAKDAGRLKGGKTKSGKLSYFQDYKKNKGNIKGHSEHGYFLVAPHVTINVGGKEVSGTVMRELLGSPKFDDKERKKLFKQAFGYFNQGIYNMMTNKFKKLFEAADMEFKPISMHYTPSKKKKLKAKFKDGEGKELIKGWLEEGVPTKVKKVLGKYVPTNVISNNTKLIAWIQKNPMLINQLLRLATEGKLDEVKLPIKVGDTVMMGRFKNKKVVVKSIDYNEKGDLLINGRPALKFRIVKKDVDEVASAGALSGAGSGYPDKKQYKKLMGKISKTRKATDSNKEYQYEPIQKEQIDKFLTTIDIQQIIENTSSTMDLDDGPNFFYPNSKPYMKRGDRQAQKLGFEVVNYILDPEAEKSENFPIYPEGPPKSVTYLPAGGSGKTPNSQEEFTGTKAYSKWVQHIQKVAQVVGYELVDFLQKSSDERKRVAKDSTSTAKQQKSDEPVEENVLTKDWWKELIKEEQIQLDEGVKFNNFLKDWSKKSKQPFEKVNKSLNNKNTFAVAKLNDFSVDKLFDSAKKGFKTYQKIINYVPDKIAKVLQKTKFGKEKDKALGKLDDYLKKHPNLKRVMGIAAGASITYAWTKMTFVGDPEYDLDLSGAASAAAAGDYTMTDLFSGELGTKFLVLTAVGAATGLSAPYTKILGNVGTFASGISFGAYRAVKKGLAKKKEKEKEKFKGLPDKVKNPNPNGRSKEVGLRGAINWISKNKGNKAAKKYVRKLKTKSIKEIYDITGEVKSLLVEGGAYGHMAHPFDDKDLTFGDLKQIIKDGLGGNLSREDNVTEKLDGQNIMVSWKDGKLIAARNKGHIKNGGKTALDTKGIISKFKGRGDIRDAFVFAMKDLEKAIKSLSQKQRDKIFNNGYNFMNMEVMWPKSANVVDYDKAELVFHGALRYDDSGKVLGEVPGSGRILAGMIKQRNQNIQKKYKIGKPVFLTVPKHQDFSKMKGKFLGRLSKLQSKFGLSDNDTLGLYHQKWWEQYILKQLKKISPKVLEGLVKRWAFFDKSYKIPQIKQDLKDEPIFLEWVLKTDKENHAKIVKDNMRPFETLFFEVGAEILKNVQGFMAANPDKAVQNMKKKLSSAIKDVKGGGDIKKLNRLKVQLDRLNAIGGTKAIVPSEGIVFKYQGKTYKFTGAFAPVNQITGLVSF